MEVQVSSTPSLMLFIRRERIARAPTEIRPHMTRQSPIQFSLCGREFRVPDRRTQALDHPILLTVFEVFGVAGVVSRGASRPAG
jgi:hypothetical protein